MADERDPDIFESPEAVLLRIAHLSDQSAALYVETQERPVEHWVANETDLDARVARYTAHIREMNRLRLLWCKMTGEEPSPLLLNYAKEHGLDPNA